MEHNNCQDYNLFFRAGLSEIYETIGNYNLFMLCETPNTNAFRTLPTGYSFRLCRHDELEIWKCIVVEERYVDYVTDFYKKVYIKDEDEFFRGCTFICDANDKPVASCFIWFAYGRINTVGWFRVLLEYEGKGLGRALLTKLFNKTQFPIYLHTQPTSICAIKLYCDFGFKFITNPIIGYRKNNLSESLPYIQKVMPEIEYAKLQFVEVEDNLQKVALSSEKGEF